MLAWPLFGAGMENFGRDDKPCSVDVPEIAEDELLVRIDAIGLCFSDVKLIRAGQEHPRVISENLAEDPVIPGHEAVMSVVRAGDKLKDQFKPGQRFIIQADVYVNGVGYAYGYAINGGMAQYSVIDQRILNGDEGCYLLPLSDDMPAATAALLEPWTCVQASYMIENRTAPKKGSDVLVASGSDRIFSAGELLKNAGIASLTLAGLSDAAADVLEKELGIRAERVAALPEDRRFDDIFCCDVSRELGEKAAKLGKRGMTCSFVGDFKDEAWSFDAGAIHYQGYFYQGTEGTVLSGAYGRNVRSKMKKNGVCWLPGGAGAMGQMHTQLAVENPDGPSRILVSDMDDSRIANVKRQLAGAAEKRGVELVTLNPSKLSKEEFSAFLKEFAPQGFDDIIMLVPVVPVLEDAAKYLAEDGLMNIFAGIPAGREGKLPVKGIVSCGMRFIGSSGSRTEHLRHTLALAESGSLKPVTALAAVGGMKALKQGLDAVINAKYPGKTVIFPNCPDMPLTPTGEMASLGVAGTLDKDGLYTLETEKALMKKYNQD